MFKRREWTVQNQSLRYAIHQLTYTIGIVAAKAHHSGKMKSAAKPSTVKLIQKIFRSMKAF
jgi:hypothetical protein